MRYLSPFYSYSFDFSHLFKHLQGKNQKDSGHIVLKAASVGSSVGGSIELESGSSHSRAAGDINIKTGMGDITEDGGNINMFVTHEPWKTKNWHHQYYYDNEVNMPKFINFGFDEVYGDSSTKRDVSLQLRRSANSTRLVSTGTCFLYDCFNTGPCVPSKTY